MSKERELLVHALDRLKHINFEDDHLTNDLIQTIQKYLAQPEQEQFPLPGERLIEMWRDGYDAGVRLAQSKQEPVVWMYEYAVRSSFDASFTGEWKEEISRTKPDGVVKGFNPTKLESTVRNLIPLYTEPPKREPIEEGELEVWHSQHTWAMDKQEYMWGFRDAEKAHGIGGKE